VSIFDAVGSLLGGGGGSSSASVTTNLNINGLDKMKSTIHLDPVTVTETIDLRPVELKPFTFNENIDMKPLELRPVTLNENIDVKPLELRPVTLNENIDVKPVTVSETFDLRPVAIDSCQTMRLAPLPDTHVCQPYRHHVSYTMFGVEWSGVTYEGESEQMIESPRRPQVVERHGLSHHRSPGSAARITGDRGIRVRVVDPDDDE
jgi:hypothetical protein